MDLASSPDSTQLFNFQRTTLKAGWSLGTRLPWTCHCVLKEGTFEPSLLEELGNVYIEPGIAVLREEGRKWKEASNVIP